MSDDVFSNKDFLDDNYKKLNYRADKIYEFVLNYHEYMYTQRNYGSNRIFNMMEIHTLTLIQDNPEINITKLSKMWGKSKSAVSQTVKKLVQGNYVYKIKKENNEKEILLKVTESGEQLSYAHKAYDLADITQTMGSLLLKCTEEEIDAFYKVIDEYILLVNANAVVK